MHAQVIDVFNPSVKLFFYFKTKWNVNYHMIFHLQCVNVQCINHFQTDVKREEAVPARAQVVETREVATETGGSTTAADRAPRFTAPLHDVVVQEGEKLTLECRVTGQPEPQVTWFKDHIAIANDNPDYTTSCCQDGVCKLSIEETFAEDSAKFSCKATNSVGNAETAAVVAIKGFFF